MVAQTRHSGSSPSKKKLSFSDKLLAKGISTDALLKKLKALHVELNAMDQEHVDVTSLASVRKELINTSILLHKDRGVKAYAACCLADILRLYAPDAPYTQAELRDIFQFFLRQLTAGLKGTDSPYYDQYFHLLESLSTVKSVVLVCDLPNADELLADIFRDFFALVRRDLSNKKVEMFVADILVALIDECQTLPPDVLEVLMSQFMDKNTRIEQPAYRLAVQVCNATADRMQRHVSQYFSDIIYSNAQGAEDYTEVRTAHDLIKRLYESCPGLLHSVIPQLEEELRAEDNTPRSIAVRVLGEMFSGKGGADLVKKYPTTWSIWLSKRNDKASSIRVLFVEATRGLISNLPEFRDTIEEALRAKLLDPDERVRAAACKLFSQLDYETALHHVSDSQLRAVADRGKDKKSSVRAEALNSLAKLYNLAYPEIENNEPSAVKQFAWIPDEVLQMVMKNNEVRVVVEQVLAEFILPLPSNTKGANVDEVVWIDRLLHTMKYLTQTSINALLGLSGLKNMRPTVYEHFIEACITHNGGIIDEDEETVTRRFHSLTQFIANNLPDPHKATEDLQAFAKLNEPRLYKLMKTCMDPQTDVKTLVKTTHEFEKRLAQSMPTIVSTMTALLRRASYWVINQSAIPVLLKRMQRNRHSQILADHAQTLLTYISKHSPSLYKSHVSELCKGLLEEKNHGILEVCLHALAALAQWDESSVPHDARTIERVTRYALHSNPRHAKFAARFLAFASTREKSCAELVEKIGDELDEEHPDVIVARIAALAQLARFAPEAFERRSDVIMSFLLKKVLMVPIVANQEEMETDEEWFEDYEVPEELRAKLLALKVCRNRSLAFGSSEKALEIATPVLKMLSSVLENNGSLSPDATENPRSLSRMRLQAAVSLLHMSAIEVYADALTPKFLRLAVVVQDSCFNVRMSFLNKLIRLLQLRKIPARYNVILFLTIHDPEPDVKTTASSYVQAALKKLPTGVKIEHLEMTFIRLLHLLAHHPDFNTVPDDLMDIAKYIQFYLDLVASTETISLLYHIAMKGKTLRDAESHSHSENFYIICEIAQELIKARAHQNSWSVQSYPGKVTMPADILRALPNPETTNKVVKTVYLSEEASAALHDLLKPRLKANPKPEKKEKKQATKRKAPAKASAPSKRVRKSSKKWRSDDEDDEEDEPGDDSEPEITEYEADRTSSRPPTSPGSDDESRRRLRPRRKGKVMQSTTRKADHVESDT
ncbi:Armadillo-type fold [Amanita muscaria]